MISWEKLKSLPLHRLVSAAWLPSFYNFLLNSSGSGWWEWKLFDEYRFFSSPFSFSIINWTFKEMFFQLKSQESENCNKKINKSFSWRLKGGARQGLHEQGNGFLKGNESIFQHRKQKNDSRIIFCLTAISAERRIFWRKAFERFLWGSNGDCWWRMYGKVLEEFIRFNYDRQRFFHPSV